MRSLFKAFLSLACVIQLALSASALEWEAVPQPRGEDNSYSHIRLVSNQKRIYAVWVGNKGSKSDQVIYCSIPDKKMEWENPQALFFGGNLDNVVATDISLTRDRLGICAIRRNSSKRSTYEAFYSYSKNSGWEFTEPSVFERFSLSDSVPPAVRLASLRGTRNSEYLLSWSSGYGDVQSTIITPIRKTLRVHKLLELEDPNLHYGVESRGRDGFYVWWLKGKKLLGKRLSNVTGSIEEKEESLLSVDQFVASTGSERGPAYLVGLSQGGPTEIAKLENDEDPVVQRAKNVPVPGKIELFDITQQDDDQLYMAAVISRKGKYFVIGRHPEDNQWQEIGVLDKCDGKELAIQVESTNHNILVCVTDKRNLWSFQAKK